MKYNLKKNIINMIKYEHYYNIPYLYFYLHDYIQSKRNNIAMP